MPSQDSIHNWVNRTPVLRREGDYWTMAYDIAVVRLKDAKGLRYLGPLLRQPGQSFHVAELSRVAATAAARQLRAGTVPGFRDYGGIFRDKSGNSVRA